MQRPRFTIARWMGITAVVAVNAAVARSFYGDPTFYLAILGFVALQVGLACFLRSRGRARRFWLGFEIAGVVITLVLILADIPDGPLLRLFNSYADFAYRVLDELQLGDYFADDHLEWFLVVFYFLPGLILALLGGTTAVVLSKTSNGNRLSPREPAIAPPHPPASETLSSLNRGAP